MKTRLFFLICLVCTTATSMAEEANGLRVTAQKTLLEKSKDRDAFNEWDKVEKALGIKVVLKNLSLKDLPEGKLEFVAIVKRWGTRPTVYESYAGSEKVVALRKGDETNLIVGKVPLSGYEIGGNRKEFQDSLEGWRVIVSHEGKTTA